MTDGRHPTRPPVPRARLAPDRAASPTEEWDAIAAAARLVADALAGGPRHPRLRLGHSHMLAEEMFYRAGGLVDVRPILFEGLMLHADAPLSTSLERLPGLAAILLDGHGVDAGDVLLVFSNSGRNPVTVELAEAARRRGVAVIAITSLRHSRVDRTARRRAPPASRSPTS